jgi:hypothetical protein
MLHFKKYPENKKLVLKNISPAAATNISFLSTNEKLSGTQQGKDFVIDLPEYNPNKIKSPYAFVVKLENYGRFAEKPVMQVAYENGALKPVISFAENGKQEIRFTTDGTEPTMESNLYTKPFRIDKKSIVKAKTFVDGSLPSTTITTQVNTYEWKNAIAVKNLKAGIRYRYFEPAGPINMTVFNNAPKKEAYTDIISAGKKERVDKFAFEFTGYIKIEKDAVYTFYTLSDDGSKLFIDDEEVVNNDGDHGPEEKSGRAALKKGYHKIKVLYFDSGGGHELQVFMQAGKEKKQALRKDILFY